MENLFGDIHAFIQIIAGLNFAFAVSNQFNDLLYQKVVSSIKNVKKEFSDLTYQITVAKETIRKLPKHKLQVEETIINESTSQSNSIDTNKSHDDIIQKLNVFEEDNDSNLNEIDRLISNKSRGNFFMLICFYTGLYCVLVLLYDAFHFFSYEQIIVFNLLSLLFFFFLFFIELKNKIVINDEDELVIFEKRILKKDFKVTINHKFFLLTFLFFGLISFVGIWIYGKNCPINIDYWVLLTTVLLSTIHFIWYWLLSIYNSLLISRKFHRIINQKTQEFKDFHNNRINTVIQLANEIKISKN